MSLRNAISSVKESGVAVSTSAHVLAAGTNSEHRHSGIGLMTPAFVDTGRASEVDAARAITLSESYTAHHERFVRRPPTPPRLPTAVWINPPLKKEVRTQ